MRPSAATHTQPLAGFAAAHYHDTHGCSWQESRADLSHDCRLPALPEDAGAFV